MYSLLSVYLNNKAVDVHEDLSALLSTASQEVVCVSRAATGSFDVAVTIQTADNRQVTSSCTSSCTYRFLTSATPTITSISPSTVTAYQQTLTLTGMWRVGDIALHSFCRVQA